MRTRVGGDRLRVRSPAKKFLRFDGPRPIDGPSSFVDESIVNGRAQPVAKAEARAVQFMAARSTSKAALVLVWPERGRPARNKPCLARIVRQMVGAPVRSARALPIQRRLWADRRLRCFVAGRCWPPAQNRIGPPGNVRTRATLYFCYTFRPRRPRFDRCSSSEPVSLAAIGSPPTPMVPDHGGDRRGPRRAGSLIILIREMGAKRAGSVSSGST